MTPPDPPAPKFDPIVPSPQPWNSGITPGWQWYVERNRRNRSRRRPAVLTPAALLELKSLRVRVRNLEAALGDGGAAVSC